MLTFVVFLSAALAVAARPTWNDLNNYSFDQFVTDFNFDFKESEIQLRKSIFHAELGI